MTTLYTRIANEILESLCVFDSIRIIKQNNGFIFVIIDGIYTYTLFLSMEYPSKIPLLINYSGIEFDYYLNQDNTIFTHFYLNTYYNIKDYNILGFKVWSPEIKIVHVIDNIKELVRIKTEIMYRILCFKIRYKYKCLYAYFEQYLFVQNKPMLYKTTIICEKRKLYIRLLNETEDFLNVFDSIEMIKKNNGVIITATNDKKIYELFLTSNYPFKIPSCIQYNGFGWKNYLDQDNTIFSRLYLNSYYNLKEYNIIDHNNWSPAIKILKIIETMGESIRIKTEIMYRLLCFKIRYKYKCLYAYFEKYLCYGRDIRQRIGP